MGAAGYGLAAVMSLAAAKQAKAGYQMEAQSNREQAELAQINADQEAINRTAQLNAQLASISATAGSGGINIGSTSIANIKRRETQLAKADVSATKLLGASNRRKYQIGAKTAETKGKAAVLTGISNAAGQATKAYYSE